jgi:hypothetical protein
MSVSESICFQEEETPKAVDEAQTPLSYHHIIFFSKDLN